MSRKTRKLIWSAPLMAVLAVAGALALFVVLSPNETMAQSAEMDYAAGSPLNVTVEPGAGEAKRTSLVIKWAVPTTGSDLPITGYRIDQSTDGQRWTHLADVSATARSHMATGLKPATLRYYRVFALNRAGTGRVSEAKSETTVGITEPTEVMNFDVTPTGSTTIKLDWDPPEDTGGARIIGYLIHTEATVATTAAAVGTVPARGTMDEDGNTDGIIPILAPTTEYTHTGLVGASTHRYKIYAVNWYDADMTSKQTKDPIDVRSATTHPVGQPAAPTGITAVPLVERDDNNALVDNVIPDVNIDVDPDNNVIDSPNERAEDVDVYWYWPAHNGGATITTFRVEVSKTGLWPDGAATAVSAAAATTALAGTVDVAGDDNAAITVMADVAFSITAVEPYQLRHVGAGQFLIAPGSKLYYRVFAENGTEAERRSLPSTEAAQAIVTYAMTQAAKPAPELPTTVAWSNDTEAREEMHHHDSVNLSWDKPVGSRTPTSYRVDVAEGTAVPLKWKKLEPDTRHSDPTYDHRGWRPKDMPQTFQYRIFGKDGGLIGEASMIDGNLVDPQTAPSPVQKIKATTASAQQIDLVWQKPMNDGGTDIAKYCVLATTASVTAQTLPPEACTTAAAPARVARDFVEAPRVGVLSERAPETMFMDKGLLADTTYRYRVYAMNDAVDSQASPGLAAVGDDMLTNFDPSPSSDEDPATTSGTIAPGAPTHLSAESALDSNFASTGARGVMVIWNAPADPAGAKVSGYEIQQKVNDGEFAVVKETSTRTTHYTATQPGPDEVRQYRVRARNSEDWGPWSAAATIPLPTPSAMPPAALAVTASDGAAGTATITWQAISGATSYHVAVITDDDNYTLVSGTYTEITDATVREHMFTGLTSGTAYIFAMIAETTPDTYTGLAFEKMTLQ